MWKYRGQERPSFADPPREGQESVWDYPRPPRLVACRRAVTVRWRGHVIGRSASAYRVLETASPPTLYLPSEGLDLERLKPVSGSSYCEWKGAARYWALTDDPASTPVGWSYPDPRPGFEALRDAVAFYPGRIECYLDQERVRPQPGGFYGGWVTDDIAGPVKGKPGTEHW